MKKKLTYRKKATVGFLMMQKFITVLGFRTMLLFLVILGFFMKPHVRVILVFLMGVVLVAMKKFVVMKGEEVEMKTVTLMALGVGLNVLFIALVLSVIIWIVK